MVGWTGNPTVAAQGECSAVTGGGLARDTTTKRTGELYSGKLSGMASGAKKGSESFFVSPHVDGDNYYFSVPFYVVTRPTANNRFFGVTAASFSVPEVRFELKSTGEVELQETGAGVIATTAVLSLNTWYVLGLRFKRDAAQPNTTLDQLELTLDGVSIGSSSSLAISTVATRMQFGGNLNTEAQTQGEWYFGGVRVNTSAGRDRKSTRLNSSHIQKSRMPSSA